MVVDPSNPDRFYFGTLDGQIYTSADGGKHWQLLYNFGKPDSSLTTSSLIRVIRRVLYVGAHRHNDPGGFFKSTDGGLTWRESPQLKNEALHSLAQSESDPDTLIAGTYNGIFRSDDAGETWKQLPTQNTAGLQHVESLAIDPRTTNTIYAGTFHLPYKSTDGGKTWKSIKKESSTIPTSSPSTSIRAIRITSLLLHAAASTKPRTPAKAGARCRAFLRSRAVRAPSLQHPSVPGVVFAGTTEGFWRSEKVAMRTPGW